MFLKLILQGAKRSRGQGKEGFDEGKSAAHDNADQPEGQKKKPQEGVKDEKEKRGGPAEDEQNGEKKNVHGVRFPFRGGRRRDLRRFPGLSYDDVGA